MGTPEEAPKRIVVGISDESGFAIGVELLHALRAAAVETHLVMPESTESSLYAETGLRRADVRALADRAHHASNQAAPISSGSFLTLGMIIAPCGRRSLESVSRGYADDLVHRAADVTLKEHRPLVLAVRQKALAPIDVQNVERIRSIPGGSVVLVDEEVWSSRIGVEEVVTRLVAPFGPLLLP